MFKKKWTKILGWTLSVIIILGIGGALAANYAVNKLMNSMAAGLEPEAGGIAEPQVSAEPAAPTATAVPQGTDSTNTKPVNTATNSNINDNTNTQAVKEQTQPSSSPAPKSDSLTEYTPQISTEKTKKIQENVSVKDKADVVSIVLGQLSVSDIKRLQALAQGGLSLDEKKEARALVMGKVSEQQYNELVQIAKKYGVSEGKSRSQVLAEEKAEAEKGSE
ncbi:hypothetical protein [Paenibacillus sabinae]|uniref:Uncharacterized protein n=1 Tax=Paenibacillus sabinae T27 TaxID=1268072 RepID=X4ZQ00_9BACL|nr:hypothetical protein [Paenibacillus sabinae]AHV98600.1 hypothetical protein PSAB_18530 [Paenibacillus sabinae T27]